MQMRKKLLSMLVLLTAAAPGAWAQDEVTLTPQGEGAWTLVMPASNVELEVTYFTQAELDQQAAEDVVTKINAIGEVAYTEECKARIEAARAAYDALTDDQKALITAEQLAVLTAAEAAYEALKPIEFTWDAATNTGTLTMPASDVELQVEYETELALSETADNTDALDEWNGYEADVTLTRTLQTGGYNTFAVPFGMTIPSGWTVKELSNASLSEGVLTLNFADASSIEAGKPYLVKVDATTDLAASAITGVIVSKDAVPFTSTDVDFIPTLGATTITGDAKNILFLSSDNTLLNPSAENQQMKGFRAYFLLKGEAAQANARAFVMNFGNGDQTTGIITISADQPAAVRDGIYDLQGRRIEGQPTQKGVYIVNGKKVIK